MSETHAQDELRVTDAMIEAGAQFVDPSSIFGLSWQECRERAKAILLAALQADPEYLAGWKLVPVKPTLQMSMAGEAEYVRKGLGVWSDFHAIYAAMLAASPPPEYLSGQEAVKKIREWMETWDRVCDVADPDETAPPTWEVAREAMRPDYDPSGFPTADYFSEYMRETLVFLARDLLHAIATPDLKAGKADDGGAPGWERRGGVLYRDGRPISEAVNEIAPASEDEYPPELFDWLEANAERYGLHGMFARGTNGVSAPEIMAKLIEVIEFALAALNPGAPK